MAELVRPRMRAGARAWQRLLLVAAAAAVLALLRCAASFVLGVDSGLPHKTAPGRSSAQYRTQVSATKTAAKPGKKKAAGKYRGPVNPSLRMLLGSQEYRQIVDLLSRVNEEGQLDNLLERAEAYWGDINIFKLAMDEQQGGGRGVLQTIRKDWPRIWPEELEEQRMTSFDTFTAFWKRLERSKVVDKVMKEVLPDAEKDYSDTMASKDRQQLADMTADERREVILKRMGKSDIVKQYGILSKSDTEVKSLAPKMGPFIARFVVILEQKLATQTEALGKTVDYGLIAAGVIAAIILLNTFGIIKIPGT